MDKSSERRKIIDT